MLESSFEQNFRNAACLHGSLQKTYSEMHMHVCILFAIDNIYTDLLERSDNKNNNVYHVKYYTPIYLTAISLDLKWWSLKNLRNLFNQVLWRVAIISQNFAMLSLLTIYVKSALLTKLKFSKLISAN